MLSSLKHCRLSLSDEQAEFKAVFCKDKSNTSYSDVYFAVISVDWHEIMVLQNAHTRKTACTFFCILQLIYKENRTDVFSQNRTETKPNLKNPFRTSVIYR